MTTQQKKETTSGFFGKLFRAGVRRIEIPKELDPDLAATFASVKEGILGPDPTAVPVEGTEIVDNEAAPVSRINGEKTVESID